jgi:outer membrane receptor protein involved in Fe transport
MRNKAFADSSFCTMDLALDYQFTKGWSLYGKIYNLTNDFGYTPNSGRYG